ncbi:DDE_3 domain-containing protein [Trichonephila clavipes]|nr:DDE_3 domain-containing protein [Trichonephila clavipes]
MHSSEKEHKKGKIISVAENFKFGGPRNMALLVKATERFYALEYCSYFDLYVFDNVEQKVCYFRVVSAWKTIVRLLNVPQQTMSDAICRFKELGNDGRSPGSGGRTLEAPRKLSNIANIQSRSWSEAEFTRGKTPLVFVEEGVKIDQKVYHRDTLEAAALSWTQKHLGNANWTFQIVSALAHKTKKTQKRCKANFPGMISSEE